MLANATIIGLAVLGGWFLLSVALVAAIGAMRHRQGGHDPRDVWRSKL